MGCCQPVLGPIENYYTKPQIDRMIDEIESAITSGCCITPEEVDEKIEEAISGITVSGVTEEQMNQAITSAMTIVEGEIPSLDGYATEQWVENQGYLTEHQHLKTINGQSLIGDGDIEIGTGGTIDLSNYYTTAQTVSLVESAVTRVEGEMPVVPTSNTAFTNDAGYLTQHQSLSGYATEQWVEDKHYITGVDLSNYATKAEIPVVPTSNTAFTNDAGYLTQHQSLSAYSTTQEVTNMINQSASGKVNTTTYNSYTASTQTTINSKADSSTLNNYLLKNKIWCGTQAEYDSIVNKDSETLYLIHS